MLSLLLAAGAWAAESRLQAFLDQIKSLDAAGKKAARGALTQADLKAMHMEYKAMSPEGKKAVDQALGRKKGGGRGGSRAPKGGIGTVQYDTGTGHVFRDDWNGVVGNRFNTGFGNPHTISVVTFQMNGTFAFTPVRVYGPPAGTIAPVLAGTTFAGLPIGTLVTWDINPNIVGHNGTFLVGVQQSGSFSTISSTWVGVDVDINNGGQGFHGMNITLSGAQFNANPTVAPGVPFNTIMRATGNNLPVELMNFDVQ